MLNVNLTLQPIFSAVDDVVSRAVTVVVDQDIYWTVSNAVSVPVERPTWKAAPHPNVDRFAEKVYQSRRVTW